MAYKRITLAKKSIYDWLYEKINESEYTIGEGVGEVRLYNAYPDVDSEGNYVDLVLPAVALDFSNEGRQTPEDLGVAHSYSTEFEVDIFARNDLEREYLANTIKDAVEIKSIPYKDYNSAVEITPTISYLRTSEAKMVPIRVEAPGDQEKHRGKVYFSVILLQDY